MRVGILSLPVCLLLRLFGDEVGYSGSITNTMGTCESGGNDTMDPPARTAHMESE